jgi:UPF0716 protein FxsA
MPLLLIVIVVALVEIAVLVEVGRVIGSGWTLLLVLASAAAGVLLIRYQGMAMLRRAVDSLNRQELPLKAGLDGICLALAGLLFVIPGFVTDLFAFLLLLPPVRAGLWRALTKHLGKFVRMRRPASADVIEGDFRRIDPGRKIDHSREP